MAPDFRRDLSGYVVTAVVKQLRVIWKGLFVWILRYREEDSRKDDLGNGERDG